MAGVLLNPPSFVWPNATNTGPVGTLTPSGGLGNITTDNTVIQNLNITGNGTDPPIKISAKNCVIQNCLIDANGAFFGIDASFANGAISTTVRNCRIINSNPLTRDCIGLILSGTAIANDISGCVHCISIDSACSIYHNYMHDMNGSASAHYECIFYGGGGLSAPNLIRFNTMYAFDTAVVFIQDTFGGIDNTIIDSNQMFQQSTPYPPGLHSTSDTVALQGTGTSVGCQITNNIMEVGFFDYASVSGCQSPGCLWVNNRDRFTNAIISTPPGCFTP